jgi:hypothetical protein
MVIEYGSFSNFLRKIEQQIKETDAVEKKIRMKVQSCEKRQRC